MNLNEQLVKDLAGTLPCVVKYDETTGDIVLGDSGVFHATREGDTYSMVYRIEHVQINIVDIQRVLIWQEPVPMQQHVSMVLQNTACIAHWIDHVTKALMRIDEELAHVIRTGVLPKLLTSLSSYMSTHFIAMPVLDIRGDTKSVAIHNPDTKISGSGFNANIYLHGAILKSFGSVHMDASCPHSALHHFLIALMAHNHCLTKVQ